MLRNIDSLSFRASVRTQAGADVANLHLAREVKDAAGGIGGSR
jgi:hypothetical protein